MMPLRTRGSPPVRRSFRAQADEGRGEPVELLQGQHLGLGQEVMCSAMQ